MTLIFLGEARISNRAHWKLLTGTIKNRKTKGLYNVSFWSLLTATSISINGKLDDGFRGDFMTVSHLKGE